jgi:protein phosphatase 1L
MRTPSDLYKECRDVAKALSLQPTKVKFNKSLCTLLGKMYMTCLDDLDRYVYREGVLLIDPLYKTAVAELRRIMFCGEMLVTHWTSKDWWKSVITSSDSASLQEKVVLHLRELLACVNTLKAIANPTVKLPFGHHRRADLLSLEDCGLRMSDVEEASKRDVDSLMHSTKEFLQGRFHHTSNVKLARHLLAGFEAEFSNDGQHPHFIEYADVHIHYDKPLGEPGSSGSVYKCEFLGLMAAAKVFRSNTTNRMAVENEVNLLSRMRHPNIVRFIGYTFDGNRNVIVTELMSKDLRSYLDEKKSASDSGSPDLSLLVVIDIMLQIAQAVNFLHENGVMHRDLKANNALVNVVQGGGQDEQHRVSSSSVQVKLTDFGLSKLKLHDSKYTTRMVGTTPWMAPEVFGDETNAEKYTKSADIYSFGMMFFEVLTGEIPYSGILRSKLLRSVREGRRPCLPPSCPVHLCEFIKRCWATRATDRPHFSEICRVLVNFKGEILGALYPSPQKFTMEDETGTYLSENIKFSFGFSRLHGKMGSIEDFLETKISNVDGQVIAFFGVFDGHNGSGAAKYLKMNLFDNFVKQLESVADTKLAIAEAYKQTDQNWTEHNQSRVVKSGSGSTACTVILVADHLLVANVGDSRAVICRGGNAVALSIDHKPNRADERQRIEDTGGVLMCDHTWIVGDLVSSSANNWVAGAGRLSRAFGDAVLKPYVVADPEIQKETIKEGDDFLIVASAGLWNVMSMKTAVSMVKSIPDATAAACKLTKEAHDRGSADKITCVVVRFNHYL